MRATEIVCIIDCKNRMYHETDISLYSNNFGFLRAPLSFEPDKSDADVIITGVPFDSATSGRPGCRYGAQAIRQASINLAWEHKRFPWNFALADRLKIADCGDVVYPSGDSDAMVKALEVAGDLGLKREAVIRFVEDDEQIDI